jgi:hypothetical protein
MVLSAYAESNEVIQSRLLQARFLYATSCPLQTIDRRNTESPF